MSKAHRTFRLYRVVAVLLMASVSPLCHGALFGDDEARRQIAAERKRVDEMSARMAGQSQQLDTIIGRLGKVEDTVGRNQGLLDLFREIEILKQDLAKMRGQLEVLNNGIETAQKRQQDFYVDLDTRLRRLENPAVAPAASTSAPVPDTGAVAGKPAAAAPGPGGPPPATGPAVAPVAETRAYEAAQNQRRIGNFQGAIVAFQNFVKQYPKSPLASSAQYWIGDSYFNIRDFRLAIASQRLLVMSYPDSAKVPDALLNIASSQAELGETAAARKTMDEIVAKHPTSDAADKARRRIATLR
jgi:tol-pal system protein YbgF